MFSPGFGKETINNFNPTQDVIDLPQSMFAIWCNRCQRLEDKRQFPLNS